MFSKDISNDILNVIIDEKNLKRKTKEIAEQVSLDYEGKDVTLVCIMNGAVFFSVDLLRELTIPAGLDFISVSSYHGGTESSGKVLLIRDIEADVSNRHVLLVDDIFDSGRTMSFVMNHIKAKGALSVRTCSLLDKPSRRVVPLELDYRGFTIPDVFIVGYGMDYKVDYRQLPFIGELKPEVYQKQDKKKLALACSV